MRSHAVSSQSFVGIDLGGDAIFAVRIVQSDGLQLQSALLCGPDELADLVGFCRAAASVSIDAPSELCNEPHRHDAALKPKWQGARCCEVALGQQFGIWVSWATPTTLERCQGWMRTGFEVWRALRAAGHEPLETYPHGAFVILAGSKPPTKSSVLGLRARVELLSGRVQLPQSVVMWGHDGLDAAVAAVVAADRDPTMRAFHDHAGCDDSSIWLPRRPEAQ